MTRTRHQSTDVGAVVSRDHGVVSMGRSAALTGVIAVALLSVVALVAPRGGSTTSGSTTDRRVAAQEVALGTPSTHLVVVMLENKEYSAVVGNATSAPYLNGTLVPSGKLFTMHYASTHPSLPNYLVLTSGQYGGCVTDTCAATSIAGPNLFSNMNAASPAPSWRVYAEGMPSNCYGSNGSSSSGYLVRHNPPVYYSALGSAGDGSCAQRDLPLSKLSTDLQGGTVPDFAMVIPNKWNDMHTDRNLAPCQLGSATQNEICQGDRWMSSWLPQLISDGGRNDTTVLVTFDEGSTNQGGAGHVLLLEIGPTTCTGCRDNSPSNHYGLSNAIEHWLSLPPLYPSQPVIEP
jgi:hypothetical protein